MTQQLAWAQALNITPDEIQSWSAKLKSGQSLLEWGLENGRIPELAYLAWASESLQLPIVKSSFFTNLQDAPVRDLLRIPGPWSRHCLPVYQWDQIVFVACDHLPASLDAKSFQVVLAEPRALAKLWDQLYAKPSAPAGATLSLEEMLADVVKTPASVPEPAPPEEFDGPAGLTLNLSSKLSSDDFFGALQTPETITTTPVMASPPTVSVPPPPPPIETAPPAPVVAPPPPPPTLRAESLPTKTSGDAQYASVLSKLGKPYERGMILMLGKGVLRPVSWTEGWFGDKSAAEQAYSFEQASIFKIVKDSLLPYHGYVAPCPVNDLFFAKWNQKKLPAHVTVVPVTVDRQLVGVILGAAEADLSEEQNLEMMERLSVEFSTFLLKQKAA